jgi:hypothetical protein
MLIRRQNRLEDLNALVVYEIIREGEENTLYLYNAPDMRPSEELYTDAMKKLAKKMVEEKIDVAKIRKIFPYTDWWSEFFKKNLGFSVGRIDEHSVLLNKLVLLDIESIDRNVAIVANMKKEDFLQRFGGNSEAK